ncbi:hypothetical protein INT48_002080, partial [Thamnidium elegans]
MITLLKNSTFVKDGTEIVIRQRNGPMIQEILPVNYQLEENSKDFLPPPLDHSCMISKVEEREFSRLFTKSLVQLIHSTYFGLQGIREGSMKSHPFHASFVKSIPRNLNDVTITDPYVMKMALSTYMTNFENMWSDGKRATKAEAEQRKEMNIRKDQTMPSNHISIINKSYNECDIENKQKWANKAAQCNIRIETYSNRAAVTNFTSTNNNPNDDTSNLELEVLEILNPKIAERAIEKEDALDTDTTRRHLMANDIMQYTGYEKSRISLLPTPQPSTLNCFKVDASSLFSMFSSQSLQHPMDLYDFEGNAIVCRETATELKDVIFSSFFDMKKLHEVASSHGLKFCHNIMLLPEVKTVRITGSLIKKVANSTVSLVECESTNKSQKKKYTDSKKTEIEDMRQKAEELRNQLRKLYIESKGSKAHYNIQQLKNQWVHSQENISKDNRLKINQDLYKKSKSKKRLEMESHLVSPKLKKRVINKNNYKCLDKTENLTVDKELIELNEVTFSGTDNGFCTMKGTGRSSLKRFEFTLDLYNRYSVLGQKETGPSNIEDSSYLKLPTTFKIYSKDIDYGSGQRKVREQLQRNSRNINDVESFYKKRKEASARLQAFYYSQKQIKRRRTYELQKRKYVDRLCSNERNYVASG